MKSPVLNPAWPDEVRAVYQHDLQEIWDPRVAKHIWNQYHNQLDIYLSLVDSTEVLDILDVGCAQATLALLLAERGHRVWAMDLRQHFLDYAASRYEKGDIKFICGNAMEVDLDHRFDMIFANQIVEHLVYPLEFTRKLAGWLKRGGKLVMTTPNADYLKNSLPTFSELGDFVEYESRQFSADGDGHFFAYTPSELKEIFERAGLSDVNSQCFETPFISGHMKVRFTHNIMPVSILRQLDRLTLRSPKIGNRLAHQLMVTGSRT